MQSDTKAAKDAQDAYLVLLNSGSASRTISGYGKLAANYDKDSADSEYNKNPQHGAFLCGKYLKNSKNSVVLDVGAGTGMLGYHLRTVEKFQGQIDIIDGSIDMLYQASKKGIRFRSIIQLQIDAEIPLPRNSYDAVTCVGAFLPNHIPALTVQELLALVKPGGFLIINDEEPAGQGYLNELHGVIKRLEKAGKMTLVEESTNPQTCLGGILVFYVFRKCC